MDSIVSPVFDGHDHLAKEQQDKVERALHKLLPNHKTVILIDGANTYSAARGLGLLIDYDRLSIFFRERCELNRIWYYTAIDDSDSVSAISSRKLVDWLEYNGFGVVKKPMKEWTSADGKITRKGNMDVEIAIDFMRSIDHYDHIILFSGDGDFRKLVEVGQENFKTVTVCSTMETRPPFIADELRRQADQFIDLNDLKPFIRRKDYRREDYSRRMVDYGPPPEDIVVDDDDLKSTIIKSFARENKF